MAYCSNINLGVTVCTICYLREKKANEHYQVNSLFTCYSCPLPKALNSTKMKESDGTAKINNFQTKSSIKLGFYVSKSNITKFFCHCHHYSDWELNDAQGHCHCHCVLKSELDCLSCIYFYLVIIHFTSSNCSSSWASPSLIFRGRR